MTAPVTPITASRSWRFSHMGFGGKPATPKPKPDPAVQEAQAQEAAQRRSARGFASTVYSRSGISDLVANYSGGGLKQTYGA